MRLVMINWSAVKHGHLPRVVTRELGDVVLLTQLTGRRIVVSVLESVTLWRSSGIAVAGMRGYRCCNFFC